MRLGGLMRLSILVLCIASFILSATAQATTESECAPVDYRNSFSLKHRNQKKVAWCFAHASADNLQLLEKTQTQISAADIAISFSSTNYSKILNFLMGNTSAPEYGLAFKAIKMLEKQGYCPESVFPSEDWEKVANNSSQSQKIEVAIAAKEIFKLHKEIHRRQQMGEIVKVEDFPFYYRFKNVDQKTFAKLMVNSSKTRLLENLRQTVCANSRVSFKHALNPKMSFGGKKTLSNINQNLSNRLPASIDFNSKMLKNIDNAHIALSLHTVAVMGRKFDTVTNQCQYLIKDSYGEQCDKYDPRLKCENGYIWIPENILTKSTTSGVVLQ